jgi:hypothetical protein
MPKTTKAIRHKRRKVLTKRMKEQTRNAAMIVKRIAKIKKDIWKLDLEDFKELGLLSQLTWEYTNWVRLMGCTAIGFRSVETTGNSKVVKKIQKWIWKHDNKEFVGEVRFFTKDTDDYEILLALKMNYAEDDDFCEHEDKKTVTVFAIDVEETGTGHNAEEKALKTFAENWDMKAEIK